LPVSTLINGYYGINDVCISIPSIVNLKGVEQYVSLELSDEEQVMFKHSANTLRNFIKSIDL
jgi:L-lactate dehydrogenase